jgi:hypothetical protein
MIKKGKVSAIDNDKRLIRVVFNDFENNVSAWLPVLCSKMEKATAVFSTTDSDLTGNISGNLEIDGTATLDGKFTGTLDTNIDNYTGTMNGAAKVKSPGEMGQLNFQVADKSGPATADGGMDISIDKVTGSFEGTAESIGTGKTAEKGTIKITELSGKLSGACEMDIDFLNYYTIDDIVVCAFFSNDLTDGVILGKIGGGDA